ncbi:MULTISPECIES: sigma-54-dependent transcriptional regulator [Niastella]|uniref:Sigma-54-dependent Fis family transcriptional regulator n=1 Tax=Niastella soli TaxID=2821487 RepID=A0ABS3YRE8_9BACT|nr:sigma-54 dependent transcriptional regulator [Niastella soli]MBO9200481.1 sigma-54-dependent Fis family transcriptional regulator [Niastella soli]
MKTKILIVEDHFVEAVNLRIILDKAGYEVCSIASSYHEALAIAKNEHPDMVFLDIYLKGKQTGIDLAKVFKQQNIGFVFLSANSDRQTLEAAKMTDPYGFLVKPFREKDVLVTLDVAWYRHRQNKQLENRYKQAESEPLNEGAKLMIVTGHSMKEVVNNIKVVASSDISVLILGESGTGKELAANYIHNNSSRNVKPFVVINCAALAPNLVESELFGHEKGSFTGATDKRVGKFEQADGGTIFLDEIGELPLDMQVKLLRSLQEKEVEPIGGKKKKVDVRIIAATNRILEDEIAAGRFRMDLYYRLNVFPIQLPPLRERREDILPIAKHFMQYYARKENKDITGMTDNVTRALMDYHWPGNIRELENVMARTILLSSGPIIHSVSLPVAQSKNIGTTNVNTNKKIYENERDYIIAMLKKSGGKIYGEGGAAELMDINASTLVSRMKKLGIEKNSINSNNS